MLLNIFVETAIFSVLFLIESSKEQHLFETEIFCNILHAFDQFNVSLLKKKKSSVY